MTRMYSSAASKRLALKFILDNIDYRKKSLYLQEIIALGKTNEVWLNALTTFFDTPYRIFSDKKINKN